MYLKFKLKQIHTKICHMLNIVNNYYSLKKNGIIL